MIFNKYEHCIIALLLVQIAIMLYGTFYGECKLGSSAAHSYVKTRAKMLAIEDFEFEPIERNCCE
jgi:hypothetical protein